MKFVLVVDDLPKCVPSEARERGYEIRPCLPLYGGSGEKPFWIATKKELKAFSERPDVELDIYTLGPKFSWD